MKYILVCAILFNSIFAFAQQDQKLFSGNNAYWANELPIQEIKIPITSRWVDFFGRSFTAIIANRGWGTKSITIEDQTVVNIPTFRIIVSLENIPKNLKVKSLQTDDKSIVINQASIKETLEIEMRSIQTTIDVTFEDPIKNQTIVNKLSIQLQIEKPIYIISHSCKQEGFNIQIPNKNHINAKVFYAGVICNDSKEDIQFVFFKSSDSSWNYDTPIGTLDKNQNRETIFFPIHRPQDDYSEKTILTEFGVNDPIGRSSFLELVYNPPKRPKRARFNIGMGGSFYQYSEQSLFLTLNQKSLTMKIDFGYKLIPGVLDFGFNTFGNVFHFDYTPRNLKDDSPINPAYFYGVNGRLGYRLPIDLGATEFSFMTGWYLWGMQVSAKNVKSLYGIKNLSGPQLFLMASHMPKGHRGIWAYVKGAFVSSTIGISEFKNNEIASGFGFQIQRDVPRPLAITVDAARMRYIDKGGGISLRSITVGILKPIY